MVLLFLLALLLAWPTYGLSIIAYVAFAVLRGYLTARARMYFANFQRAQRDVFDGANQPPSWAGNKDEVEIFLEVITQMSVREGVPRPFVLALLQDSDMLEKLMFLAGAMERQGASPTEQYTAVSDKIVDMWNRAPAAVKVTLTRESGTGPTAKNNRPAKISRFYSAGKTLSGPLTRILNVLAWSWRIAAVSLVTCVMLLASMVFVVEDPVEGVLFFLASVAFGLGLTGLVWVLSYLFTGRRQDFESLVGRVVFAGLPIYFWFILGVLFTGGFGTAIWHSPETEGAFLGSFGLGAGGALVLLAIGFPGWFLAPVKYRHIGHATGTAVAAALALTAALGGLTLT